MPRVRLSLECSSRRRVLAVLAVLAVLPTQPRVGLSSERALHELPHLVGGEPHGEREADRARGQDPDEGARDRLPRGVGRRGPDPLERRAKLAVDELHDPLRIAAHYSSPSASAGAPGPMIASASPRATSSAFLFS